MTLEDDEPRIYAIRLAERAHRAIEREQERLELLSGTRVADEWQSGLMGAIRSLGTYPYRCMVAAEDVLFPETIVRQLNYQRKRGPVWRILFTIQEADADDPPVVRVQCILHGAQPNLTEWPTDDE